MAIDCVAPTCVHATPSGEKYAVNRLLFLTSFIQYGEGAFVELVMEGLAPTVERATKETTVGDVRYAVKACLEFDVRDSRIITPAYALTPLCVSRTFSTRATIVPLPESGWDRKCIPSAMVFICGPAAETP